MLLCDEEVMAFNQNQFELDCPKIVLTPQDSKKMPLHGIGSIFQRSDGQMHFKIYASLPGGPKSTLSLLAQNATLPGQIIPENEFYNLKATDAWGRVWESQKTDFDSHSFPQTNFVTLKGSIESLSYKIVAIKKPQIRNYLKLLFYQTVNLPANSAIKRSVSVANQMRSSSIKLNAWKFQSNDCQFILWDDEGILSLDCYALKEGTTFPSYFDLRVVEAMRFITAEPLSWSLMESEKDGVSEITLKSKVTKKSLTRLMPPVEYNRITQAKEAQTLFDLYLQHIKSYSAPHWHPISQRLSAILNASAGSLETEGLTLGVEIEGLVKQELANRFHIPLCKVVLKKVCNAIATLSMDENIKKRIIGFVGSMAGAKGQDILKELCNKGIIKETLFEKWKCLRNPSAHADVLNPSKIQEYFDLCHANIVLIYHLIFYIIGYRGIYTNYQQHGFPKALYNHPLSDQPHA